MAGIKLVTDTEPDKGLQLAWRAAQDLGFTLTPVQDGAFQASKGGAFWSFVAGAAAPHCSFKLSANRYGDDTTDLVLDLAIGWTAGLIGKRRIWAEADALMKLVADAIEKDGGKVIERKEI
jgi:hypothetical protein